jgi:hypothetical protein
MALGEQSQAENLVTAKPLVRRVPLHRRVCIIRPDRIEVRLSRSATVMPFAGLLLCVALLTIIAFFLNTLPYAVLALLLLISLILVPFCGMSFVYSLIGSSVIFDTRKQSGVWQQGVMGLGLGTRELVPFWKIQELVVQEAGHDEEAEGLLPLEEFAQWEVALVKTSGKKLVVGGVTVPRDYAENGQAIAIEVAEAIANLTDKPLRIEEPELIEEDWEEDDPDEDYDEEEGR